MTHIKNCGLVSRIETDMAAMSGASFVGFVHCEQSPRHVPLEAAENLAAHTQEHVKRVLVCVNPDDGLIARIARMQSISHLQVHGVNDASRLHALAGLSHKKLA
jgi:phosphoribosylanthranilate isomerase